MVRAGIIDEDEHVELLDGELLLMNAQGPVHSTLTAVVRQVLAEVLGPGYGYREHSPLVASEYDMPEPDLVVLRTRVPTLWDRHPRPEDACLVVEVSDSSARRDRRKTGIYAAASIDQYWIIDVRSRTVHVYRRPDGEGDYAEHRAYRPGEDIELNGAQVAVERIVPPAR